MKTQQITLRNVDPLLKQRLVSNAKLNSQSMNSYIVSILSKKVGIGEHQDTTKPSWKKYIGSMPENAFNIDAVEEMDKIDESMWQKK